MFTGTVLVAVCSGWLCKAIHGDWSRFPLNTRWPTEEACIKNAEQVALIGVGTEYPWRVECTKIATKDAAE